MRRHFSMPVRAGTALIACLLLATIAMPGCGGASKAQKRAFKADEAVSKERLRLVDEYERCIDKANGDYTKEGACERYLKSAEALK